MTQRGPIHQFHGDRDHGTRANHLVHGDDVRVVQGRGGLRLANEPFGGGTSSLSGDHFHGNVAIQVGVVGRIDPAHSPLADKTRDHKTTERNALWQAVGSQSGSRIRMRRMRRSRKTSESVIVAISDSIARTLPAISASGAVVWTYCRRSASASS